MTREEKKALLLLLDPAGAECLPKVLAAFRGALRFSSRAASREALPRILAYCLGGSHSSRAPPFRLVVLHHPLGTLLKALHYDPDEIYMKNLMPGADGKFTREFIMYSIGSIIEERARSRRQETKWQLKDRAGVIKIKVREGGEE